MECKGNGSGKTRPAYPISTLANFPGSYCAKMKSNDDWRLRSEMKDDDDWESPLRNLSREMMMDFFLFVGESSKISSTGSSNGYMRRFSELYTTVTGRYVDRNDYRELYKVEYSRYSRVQACSHAYSITIRS